MRTRKQRKTSRREGAALLIALLALAGLSILGLSLMLVTETELQVSNDERLRKQALYAAEAGIEHALIFMRGIDPQVYGMSKTAVPGVLSGDPTLNWGSPLLPPDDKRSYNDPVVAGQNIYDPAKPWQAPALARKGNILWFCVANARCNGGNLPWFQAGFTAKPTRDYALRDIPFEKSAGLTGAWDVGTFKSRYTVYVRNNLDDPAIPKPIPSPPYPGGAQSIYENDKDGVVVLTAEGIVDVGQSSIPGNDYYKVVRTVEVSVKTSSKQLFDDTSNAGGGGGSGNGVRNDTPEEIVVKPGAPVQRNKDWK